MRGLGDIASPLSFWAVSRRICRQKIKGSSEDLGHGNSSSPMWPIIFAHRLGAKVTRGTGATLDDRTFVGSENDERLALASIR